jgi:hypothetical protein
MADKCPWEPTEKTNNGIYYAISNKMSEYPFYYVINFLSSWVSLQEFSKMKL